MFIFSFSTAEIAKPPQKIAYNVNPERHIFQGPEKWSFMHIMTQLSVCVCVQYKEQLVADYNAQGIFCCTINPESLLPYQGAKCQRGARMRSSRLTTNIYCTVP